MMHKNVRRTPSPSWLTVSHRTDGHATGTGKQRPSSPQMSAGHIMRSLAPHFASMRKAAAPVPCPTVYGCAQQ
ncbi:hypothetical protein GCM10023194_56710 [Planotetraspora phitsanulokensis]